MIDWDYLYYLYDHSPAQYEVLLLLSRGMTAPEIAKFRGVTVQDIWYLTGKVKKNSGAKTLSHLICVATKMGVI